MITYFYVSMGYMINILSNTEHNSLETDLVQALNE